MPAPHRLSKTSDFRRVYTAGRRARSNGVQVTALLDEGSGPARLGVSVRRGAGNAVVRNRIKRRLRAAVTHCGVVPGAEVVVAGDRSVATLPFERLVAELTTALAAAGVGEAS